MELFGKLSAEDDKVYLRHHHQIYNFNIYIYIYYTDNKNLKYFYILKYNVILKKKS